MNVLILIIAFGVLWGYIRYFEWANLYHPERTLTLTPAHYGLPYEDVFFSTSDGKQLHGWFIPAEGARQTVLYCHGNAGTISGRLDGLEVFHQLGVNTFIFDYRGYGRSSGIPTEEGTYLDAVSAYTYLVSERGCHEADIVVFGKSLGGAVAIELAQRVKIYALIIESSFSSIITLGKELYPFLPVKLIVTMHYDSVNKIGHLTMPKLIVHSTEDEIIPFSHAQALFNAAAEPKDLYVINGFHNEGINTADDAYRERMKNFLQSLRAGVDVCTPL